MSATPFLFSLALAGGRFSLRRRKMEPEAECRCGGAGCHSGGFLLRIMPPSWQPVPACTRNGHSAGGPFNTATTGFRRRAILLAGTMVLHRFSISSPDLRIDAAIRSKQGQSVHRFLISGPDLRIDAAKRPKQGQSVHRFLISSPDLRIDAAKRSKQGQSLQPKGRSIMPRPGNAGWAGTSDGVAARGFVNGRGPPRSGGRESTAGAHRSEVPARRQTRPRRRLKPRRQTRTRGTPQTGDKKSQAIRA